MNQQNPNDTPFVTTSIKPQSLTDDGDGGRMYALGRDSSHPIARGFDEHGRPFEETWPIAYHRRFVHPTGTINRVPLRTGAVFSTSAAAVGYEFIQMRDLLRDGWLPLEDCPHTYKFGYIGIAPLVPPPDGANPQEIAACHGDENALRPGAQTTGCVHMQAEIRRRRKAAAEAFERERAANASLTATDVKALFGELIGYFGEQRADTNVAGRRTAMRQQEKTP